MATNSLFGVQPFEELVSPFRHFRHSPSSASAANELTLGLVVSGAGRGASITHIA